MFFLQIWRWEKIMQSAFHQTLRHSENQFSEKISNERHSKEKNEFRKNVIRTNDLVPLARQSLKIFFKLLVRRYTLRNNFNYLILIKSQTFQHMLLSFHREWRFYCVDYIISKFFNPLRMAVLVMSDKK